MKIMHVIHEMNIGGAQTLVKNYMLNFDSRNNEVILLCFNHTKDSPYEKELLNNGINVIYAQDYSLCKHRINKLTKLINHYYRYIVVKRIINTQSPDVIHMHLAVNRFVKFAKPKRRTKLFYTVHSEPKVIWQSRTKKSHAELRATRWLIKKYGMRMIVLHEKMKNEVDDMFNVCNSIVLNNGVDVDRIMNSKDSNLMREELGIPRNSFVIGHIGRFLRVKNHDFLTDVFIEIAKRNNRAFLMLVGDGPDKKRIMNKLNEAKMKNRYLILNNRNDVPDLLNAMDVFIFPSLYEGIPLSLIEAQIARKPCFISDGVNEHAIISNIVTRIALEQGASLWGDKILSYKAPNKIVVDEDDWDIRKETKKLEQIYLSALINKIMDYNNTYKEKQ